LGAYGTGPPLLDRYSATAPATCGLDMDVPLIVLYPPPFQVERMHTPGAVRSTLPPWLLKFARVSSPSLRQVGEPLPPALPSKSAIAATTSGSGYAVLFRLSLPAESVKTTPESSSPQIAL
jgi:hypothetical protein